MKIKRLSILNKSVFPAAQLYLSLSIMFGTWVIYIPTITAKLKMSESDLGFALFFGAVGSLITTPLGKILTNKYGEGRVSFYSIIMVAISILMFFLAPSPHWLCASMLFFGFNSGILQIAINSLVASIERNKNVSIMSTCHGFYSLGGIISSGLGTILLIAINNPLIHISISTIVVIILQLSLKKHFFYIKNQISIIKIEAKKQKNKKSGLLLMLAIVALSVMVTEGAIADWSGLYLKNIALTKNEFLGLGFAGFSLSMTIGRFVGDYISKKFGIWQIIITGLLIGLLGFIVVLIGHPVLSILGFFIIGIGFSIIVPEIYRISVNIDGVDPASGIAFMASAGYIGFLIGPVILGALAENFGLTTSFIVLSGLVAIGVIFALLIRMKYKLQLSTN